MATTGTDRSTDRADLVRLVQGDPSALREVYDRYSLLIHAVAVRTTGCRHAAEDVTQEVFADLWERPERYDPARGTLKGWLATSAHSTAVSWVRREAGQRRRQGRLQAATSGTVASCEDQTVAALQAEQARAALRQLSPEQRQAIELAYFGELSYREVARALGVPEGTAKSRLRLGLRRAAGLLATSG